MTATMTATMDTSLDTSLDTLAIRRLAGLVVVWGVVGSVAVVGWAVVWAASGLWRALGGLEGWL